MIADRAFRNGLRMVPTVVERAGVDRVGWWRYANGAATPKPETVLKLMDAVDALIAEQDAGATPTGDDPDGG